MPKVSEGPRPGQSSDGPMDHVTARVSASTIARLDALALLLTPLGARPSRSVPMRACLLTGLDVLEAQHAKPKATL
jgi:hypothetical protein